LEIKNVTVKIFLILKLLIKEISNLRVLIQKLEEKDKRYNRLVTKVINYKNKIEILKQVNKSLNETKQSLANEGKKKV